MTRWKQTMGDALAFALVLVAVVFTWVEGGDKAQVFWVDAASLGDLPWYAGLLSNVGVAVWLVGSGIALFTASVGRSLPRRDRLLLLCYGAFLGVLGLDDMALLHEYVLPRYLGVPYLAVVASYAVGALALLVAFHRQLLGERPWLFLFGGMCLAYSVGVDFMFPAGGHITVIEDSLKLLGAVSWSLNVIGRSYDALEGLIGRASGADEAP